MNVYLIEDEPLTLVDAGPNSGTSFDELQRGIAGLGHSLEDIELVILTHQHIDHLGLVSLVAAHSGAEVAAIDAAVRFVENYSLEAQADDDFARDTMLRNGIPEDVAAAFEAVVKVANDNKKPLFANDPSRSERYVVTAGDLRIDYSKHRLTDEVRDVLLELAVASEVAGRRESDLRPADRDVVPPGGGGRERQNLGRGCGRRHCHPQRVERGGLGVD